MRALDLIQSFSEKELDEVGQIIEQKGRKTLGNLFGVLRKLKKKSTEPSNADIFKPTFGKPYQNKEDYLLRNELRLLSELLAKQLVVNTFKKEIDSNKELYNNWLTKGLFDRKINDLFRLEVEKYLQQGKNSTYPYDTARMMHYRNLWLINIQTKSEDNLHYQLQTLEELLEEERRNFLYRLREYEARKGYIEFVLSQSNPAGQSITKTEPQYQVDLHMDDPTGWFEQYLILKKYAYQTKGKERIEVLQQMLDIEEKGEFSGEFAFNAQISTLNNLALENIYIGEFLRADELLAESLKRCEAHKHTAPPGNYLNYIANKINLGQYRECIQAYDTYLDKMVNSRIYVQVTIHRAFCLLFLGQVDEALASLPPTANLKPIEKMMVRMVYVIAFVLRGDYELARNETQNFTLTLKGKSDEDNEKYTFIASLFKTYINAFLIGRDKRAELKKLSDTLADNKAWVNTLAKSEFALLWLIRQPDVAPALQA